MMSVVHSASGLGINNISIQDKGRQMFTWKSLTKSIRGTVPTIGAQVYFESVLARHSAVHGLPDCLTDEQAITTLDFLKAKFKDDPDLISMSDALLLEQMTVRLMPKSHLKGALHQTLDHFKRLSSVDEFKEYEDSYPKLKDDADESVLRARIMELLGMIQDRYVFAPFRESVRSQVSLKITVVLLSFIAFVLIVCFVLDKAPQLLVVAMLVGGLGGLVSVQFRIQSMPADGDAIRGALSLYNGWFSVYFSPVIGAVSAVLLYMVLQGELVGGSLFPQFADKSKTGLSSLAANTSLPTSECAKLIIWSFIAGFTERIVPDTLSRLSEALAAQRFPSNAPSTPAE